MPTPEECNQLKINQTKQEARVDAIAERLDEVLEEVKSIHAMMQKYLDLATSTVNAVGIWLGKWVPILIGIAILGTQILPLIAKMSA